MRNPYSTNNGFTIVELLIVIVIIGILAGLVIVTFAGIQNKTHDTSVQNDLRSIARKLRVYHVDYGVYPVGDTALGTLKIKVAKGSYANGFANNMYNLLYCRVTADGPDKFALMASSRSGNVFTYQSATDSITTATAWGSTSSVTLCQGAGINQTVGTDRDIMYISTWASYVAG